MSSRSPRSKRATISILSTLALLLLSLAACSPRPTEIAAKSFTLQSTKLAPTDRLEINLQHAELSISGHPQSDQTVRAEISGAAAGEIRIERAGEVLELKDLNTGRRRSQPIQLHLDVPEDLPINLEIKSGSVSLQGLGGVLRVESVSAAIVGADLAGVLWVATPRGSVTISDSDAELHVLAEAGTVHFTNLHGALFATTIMGDILYEGEPHGDDLIKFETDHAGVLLRLSDGTNAEMDLTTAGGQIVCTFPGLNSTGSACSAAIGDGSATVSIRTVSGPIRIETWTLKP